MSQEFDIFDTMNDYIKDQSRETGAWDDEDNLNLDYSDLAIAPTQSVSSAAPMVAPKRKAKSKKGEKTVEPKPPKGGRTTRNSRGVDAVADSVHEIGDDSNTSDSFYNEYNDENSENDSEPGESCVEFDIPMFSRRRSSRPRPSRRRGSSTARNRTTRPAQTIIAPIQSTPRQFIQLDAEGFPLNAAPLFSTPIKPTLETHGCEEVLSTPGENSFESENYEINIKFIWNGQWEKFKLRRHQKLSSLINIMAQREKIDPKYVLLTLNDKIINAHDTPASIDYTIADFIHGRIFRVEGEVAAQPVGRRVKGDNDIEIKIQAEKFKKPIVVMVNKKESFKLAIIKCSEEIHEKPENIQLKFDGEVINLKDSPEDLEMEGGEVLDMKVLKT